MNSLFLDLRYGARMLLKQPGFTLLAVFTLALGIGAITVIFSVVNGVLLRPLPFQESDRLVMVSTYGKLDNGPPTVSAPDFHDFRLRSRTFESLAGILAVTGTLIGDGPPETVDEAIVTWNFFPLLGVEMAHGRNFLVEEDVANGPRVVILSHGLWSRRFGARPDLIGRTIRVDAEPWLVVGILPANFKLYLPPDAHRLKDKNPDLWKLTQRDFSSEPRNSNYLTTLGRLNPGATLAQAQAEMDGIAGQLRAEYAMHWFDRRIRVAELQQKIVSQTRPALLVLLVAVGFVLLIACANVANLSLSRAVARDKELAIRAALGASRSRLARLALTESFLISLCGGLLGLLLALWGLRLLRWMRPANLPRLAEVTLDWRALCFSLAVCALAALLAGLAPALRQARPDLQMALKQGGKTSAAADSRGLQSAFVMIEIALSLALLVGATLLIRTFISLQNVPPGFNPENVLTFQLTLPSTRYAWGRKAEFLRQLEERLARLPGVAAVGSTSQLPFTGKGYGAGYSWNERSEREGLTADWRFITPNYLQTTGTRLLAGRFFTEQDDAQHPRAVIIDETLARKSWPNESAIGKRLLVSDSTPRGMIDVWMEVLGVIEHVRNHALDSQGREQVYIPYAQTPAVPWMNVAVRSNLPTADLAKAIERETHALDKDLPINNVRPMEDYVADALAPARFSLILMNIFGAVALTLAAIGLYGVISYSVSRRTQEFGVRMALGARKNDVLRLIIRQGMKVALAGVLIGLAGAFALTRLMRGMLFGVGATDPAIFAGITLLLLVVALLACYAPARRATRVDPLVALRSE